MVSSASSAPGPGKKAWLAGLANMASRILPPRSRLPKAQQSRPQQSRRDDANLLASPGGLSSPPLCRLTCPAGGSVWGLFLADRRLRVPDIKEGWRWAGAAWQQAGGRGAARRGSRVNASGMQVPGRVPTGVELGSQALTARGARPLLRRLAVRAVEGRAARSQGRKGLKKLRRI